MIKLIRIALTSVMLGVGSLVLVAGCMAETGEVRTNEGANENTGTTEEGVLTACPPEAPFHCRRPAPFHCQLQGGVFCGPNTCACPCVQDCCDSPGDSC